MHVDNETMSLCQRLLWANLLPRCKTLTIIIELLTTEKNLRAGTAADKHARKSF